tara:strand:+ start:634 stop:768 length:135 start_codon:yes stop_codon:yes gene_type:complete
MPEQQQSSVPTLSQQSLSQISHKSLLITSSFSQENKIGETHIKK